MKYIHKVSYQDSNEHFATIATKAKFRREMIAHYFEQKDPRSLKFQLEDSPNTSNYQIIPYINRQGNPSVCFAKIALNEPEFDEI